MFKGWLNIFNATLAKVSRPREICDIITYSAIGFMTHFFFKNPQELLGITINILLVLAALNIRGWRLIPVIVLPSLGALLGGYFFHNMTFVVPLFMPILWLGNFILVFAFKYLYLERKVNFFLTLFIGATTKYLVMVLSAYAFIYFSLAPTIFLASMGRIQLVTAIFGGIIAFFIINFKPKNK
ncbi:MAG: hypothetical protein PHC66_03675 [Candidatus Nanoarchaeia archaeon]|nr:hypothetical protein [Candidatus Nanoarchaeia archaeon]MDD5238953.1 hypothetical protein [Candidatus Nanoarchaeia archaeon]